MRGGTRFGVLGPRRAALGKAGWLEVREIWRSSLHRSPPSCLDLRVGTCFFAYRDSSTPSRHGGAPRQRGTTGSPTPALADVAAISHVLCHLAIEIL
jgi:hypothetical protein